MKATVSLKRWFHEIFFQSERFLVSVQGKLNSRYFHEIHESPHSYSTVQNCRGPLSRFESPKNFFVQCVQLFSHLSIFLPSALSTDSINDTSKLCVRSGINFCVTGLFSKTLHSITAWKNKKKTWNISQNSMKVLKIVNLFCFVYISVLVGAARLVQLRLR